MQKNVEVYMIKKVLFFVFFVIITSLYSTQIYFLSGSFELTDESLEKISNFKEEFELFIQENPNTVITITGYTDNVGSEQNNKKLSKLRAKIIQDFLLKEMKMNPENIQLLGRGSNNPIADNNTSEGRYLNRRVEIEFENPEAIIKWLQNKVEHISSKSGETLTAEPNADLFRYDKINTENNSRSGIEFSDSNLVILEENSLMIIFGDISSSYSELLDNKFHVELKYGRLFNKLQNMKGKSINVKTPAADLELFSSSNDVEFKDNQTLASIYKGYGLVFAQGKSVTVNEGFGIKIETGKEPEEPIQLPDPPSDLSISKRDLRLDGEKIFFSWNGQAHEYLIQISADSLFENIIFDQKTQINESEFEFVYGSYFVRVKAFDNNGLKSDYSNILNVNIAKQDIITVEKLVKNEKIKSSINKFTIEGKTLKDIEIFINSTEVEISSSNTFSRTINLVKGLNTVNILAVLPNKSEKLYQYKILYEPEIKIVKFPGLYEDISKISKSKKYNLIAYAPVNTKFIVNELEMEYHESGLLNYHIKLKQGENLINIKALFADGTIKEYNYTIIYKRNSQSSVPKDFFVYLIAAIMLAIPVIINNLK